MFSTSKCSVGRVLCMSTLAPGTVLYKWDIVHHGTRLSVKTQALPNFN